MRARRATRWAVPAATALWVAIAAAGASPSPATAAAAGALATADAVAKAGAAATAGAAPPTALTARAAVLIQQGTGRVLFAEHAADELPIASTTKLMTAYVAVELEPVDQMFVEQPYTPGAGESLAAVPAGARLGLADMLRAMLLPSGNNVAYSLAVDVGRSTGNFVSLMNAWAAVLGLGRTHFTTPIGLDTPGGNYSTALDLARLTRVLLRDPLVRTVVGQTTARLADGVSVVNRNDLVGAYPWVVGVKTGSTARAGECLVAAASLNGVHVISVVLGEPTVAARDADTLALLRYGLSLYRRAQIAVRGRVYATLPVEGRSRPARLVARRSSNLVLARTATLHVSRDGVPTRLLGPLPAGKIEGAINVHENGRLIESVPLVTAAAVPAPRPVAAGIALGWIAAGGGLTIVLVGCSLPVMRRRAMRSAPGVP
jgi:serine-type D-Ala-D-Ala carboxypeptidase (penicillin-binding protein 5/6)